MWQCKILHLNSWLVHYRTVQNIASKAKNTQVKYYRGFDRWRSWASKLTEVNVLPACSIYIALFVFKLIQDNVSCHIIDAVYYGIKWVHEIILVVTKILVILQLWII